MAPALPTAPRKPSGFLSHLRRPKDLLAVRRDRHDNLTADEEVLMRPGQDVQARLARYPVAHKTLARLPECFTPCKRERGRKILRCETASWHRLQNRLPNRLESRLRAARLPGRFPIKTPRGRATGRTNGPASNANGPIFGPSRGCEPMGQIPQSAYAMAQLRERHRIGQRLMRKLLAGPHAVRSPLSRARPQAMHSPVSAGTWDRSKFVLSR